MSEALKTLHDRFQHADYDDDLITISKSLVDLMRWCYDESKQLGIELAPTEAPDKFHKMQPHFPAMKYRKAARPALAEACKIEDCELRARNIHVVCLAISYIYHLPVDQMRTISESTNEDVSRDRMEKLLLDDDMSPNWVKEPTDKDFTALYL